MSKHYRFDDLGWMQFEQFCQALLKATFGPAVISWGGRSDRGRDAFCSAPLNLSGVPIPGPFVFQVKFVSGAAAAGADPEPALVKAVKGERAEIERRLLAKDWLELSRYILLTNVPLSASMRERIVSVLADVIEEDKILCWGQQDLSDMLHCKPDLRVAFPQLLGMRDIEAILSSVINQEVLERSKAARLEAEEYAAVFVPTAAYQLALDVLAANSFAVLTGPPEMGKTTIARMIGLVKHSCGWQFLDCTSPGDFFQNLDDSIPQVFVADDAFGTTEYRPEIAHKWGQDLAKVLRRLDSRHWLIWTSRPVPLQLAIDKLHLYGPAEKFPHPGQVTVDTAKSTLEERSLMLYRHSKAADLPAISKETIRQIAAKVVQHEYLTPERIRRLVVERLPEYVRLRSTLSPVELLSAIDAEIAEPTKRMRQSFENLDPDHQWLLFAMLDAGRSASRVERVSQAFVRLTGGNARLPFDQLLENVTDHFLRLPKAGYVDWTHPSWRDLVIERLRGHDLQRVQFLRNCGQEGFRLALSVGGGTSGALTMPLLRNDEDWNALADCTIKMASGTSEGGRDLVLRLLLERCSEHSEHSEKLRALARALLLKSLEAWNAGMAMIEPESLGMYYQLGIACKELLPSPKLDNRWSDCWRALTELASEDLCDLDAVSDLYYQLSRTLYLVSILKDFEPRFLAIKGFPDCCSGTVKFLVDRLESLSLDDLPKRSEDDCAESGELIEGWQNVTALLGDYFPGLESKISGVHGYLDSCLEKVRQAEFVLKKEKEQQEYEEAMEDWRWREHWYKEHPDDRPGGTNSEARLHAYAEHVFPKPIFAVAELFRDL